MDLAPVSCAYLFLQRFCPDFLVFGLPLPDLLGFEFSRSHLAFLERIRLLSAVPEVGVLQVFSRRFVAVLVEIPVAWVFGFRKQEEVPFYAVESMLGKVGGVHLEASFALSAELARHTFRDRLTAQAKLRRISKVGSVSTYQVHKSLLAALFESEL